MTQQQERPERALPPEGRFRAKVANHDLGEASTGNPQVGVGFVFDDADGVQHRINWYGVFTEANIQAEHGVCQALRALGWDPEEKGWATEQLAKKSAENPEGGALMGVECDITIEHETYKGKKQAKVAWVNDAGGGLMKAVAQGAEGIASISERIRALAGGGGGPAPSAAPKKAAAPKPAAGAKKPAAASASGKSPLPF